MFVKTKPKIEKKVKKIINIFLIKINIFLIYQIELKVAKGTIKEDKLGNKFVTTPRGGCYKISVNAEGKQVYIDQEGNEILIENKAPVIEADADGNLKVHVNGKNYKVKTNDKGEPYYEDE